jgi:hypothetical protein
MRDHVSISDPVLIAGPRPISHPARPGEVRPVA